MSTDKPALEAMDKKKIDKRKGPKPLKKLTPVQLAEIQALYEDGTMSIRGIAKEYKVSAPTIIEKSKREGWAPYGSNKAAARERVREKMAEAVAKSYEDTIKEINEGHLKKFRAVTSVWFRLLSDVVKRIDNVDTQNIRREILKLTPSKEEIAAGKKMFTIDIDKTTGRLVLPDPDIMVSNAKETLPMERITNGLRTSITECERTILGIKDGALEKDDPSNGAKEIVRVLEEARRAFSVMAEEEGAA